jgi:hypothetical protein
VRAALPRRSTFRPKSSSSTRRQDEVVRIRRRRRHAVQQSRVRAVPLRDDPAYRLNWAKGEQRLLLVSVGTGAAPSLGAEAEDPSSSMLSTGLGIPGALMYGSLVDQDINCRAIGRCTYGDVIDRELLDMVPRQGPDEGTLQERLQRPRVPLEADLGRSFLYARYNVDLGRAGLTALALPDVDPEIARKMDKADPDHIDLLARIGERPRSRSTLAPTSDALHPSDHAAARFRGDAVRSKETRAATAATESAPATPALLVDFDVVYRRLIEPALRKAGCIPFRADQEPGAGDIRTDMFFELVTADAVVADISVLNANVFYELGVRHGVAPRGVFMIHGGWGKPRSTSHPTVGSNTTASSSCPTPAGRRTNTRSDSTPRRTGSAPCSVRRSRRTRRRSAAPSTRSWSVSSRWTGAASAPPAPNTSARCSRIGERASRSPS